MFTWQSPDLSAKRCQVTAVGTSAVNWKPNSVILLCAGMKWGKKNHKTEEAAWRRRRACADPAEEAAINKDHTIYVHFLSTALWKHITWRRDLLDLVLSQHPEHETTLADLQGRRCCSLPATASHLTIIGRAVVEKVLLVIEFSLREKEKIRLNPRRRRGPTGAQRGFVRYTEERAPWQQEKTPSGLMRQKSVFVDERLRGPWICKLWEIWFKATCLTFYIPVRGSTNSSLDHNIFLWNVQMYPGLPSYPPFHEACASDDSALFPPCDDVLMHTLYRISGEDNTTVWFPLIF